MKKLLRFFLSATLLSIFLFPLASAHAATFTVNTSADTDDAQPSDGACADSTGNCSLRAAIQEANSLSGADVIDLPAGTYGLTLPSALPNISGDLTINGAGLDATVIDGTGQYRVFLIASQVAISGVTITGGYVGNFDMGGGIASSGNLTITDSLIRDNMTGYAGVGGGIANNGGILTITNSTVSHNSIGTFWSHSQGNAGGIYNNGTLTIINSTINGNYSLTGGGIYHENGTMTISNSTISSNIAHYISGSATGNGGGIFAKHGTVDINGSTINDNSAYYGGGTVRASGIYNDDGTMTISNSTISGNGVYQNSSGAGVFNLNGTLSISNSTITNNDDSDSYGGYNGGVYNWSGTASLFNTIVANQSAGPDCYGNITSNGYNLDSDGTCNLTEETDLSSTDPLLGPLTDNGGHTLTHEPSLGSPVIDTGAAANCPPKDQRGVTRPQDGNADSIAICDMGSVEFFVIPGDVDRNLFIEMKDAILALQVMSDIVTPVPVFKVADINKDGLIGLEEAIYAFQIEAGLKTLLDQDGDSFSVNQGDCDDTNNMINPNALDFCGDGIDQDCNGSDLECLPSEFYGGWQLYDNSAEEFISFTIFNDGVYMYGEKDASGAENGVEVGTLAINLDTNVITVHTVYDQASSGGIDDTPNNIPSDHTITVNGDTLTYTEPGNPDSHFTLMRVLDISEPLIGSWEFGSHSDGFINSLTIYDNSTYIYIEYDSANPENNGVEFGTYTYANDEITLTVRVDQNGDSGTSGINDVPVPVVINGDVMTVTIPDEGDIVFNRVK